MQVRVIFHHTLHHFLPYSNYVDDDVRAVTYRSGSTIGPPGHMPQGKKKLKNWSFLILTNSVNGFYSSFSCKDKTPKPCTQAVTAAGRLLPPAVSELSPKIRIFIFNGILNLNLK